MKSTKLGTLVLVGLALTLAACTEKPQTANASERKAVQKSWQMGQSPYRADGWSGGDATAWEQQLRKRAQGQNEYSRIAPAAQ